jgi:hypothetical protein
VSDGFTGTTELDMSKCDGTNCWLDHAAIVPGTLEVMKDGGIMAQKNCQVGVMNPGEFCVIGGSGQVTLNAADMTAGSRFVASYRAHLVSAVPKTDPAKWTNADRLRVCALPGQEKVNGQKNPYYDPNFYIGNLIQPTGQNNGEIYGAVDGNDPNAGILQYGGMRYQAAVSVKNATEFFVTIEDHRVGSPDKTIGSLVDPNNRGTVVLGGKAKYGTVDTARGIMSADLTAPVNITFPAIGSPAGHLSAFIDLDSEPEQF